MATTATTTEVQNNFGKYLQRVLKGDYDDKKIRAERMTKYEGVD